MNELWVSYSQHLRERNFIGHYLKVEYGPWFENIFQYYADQKISFDVSRVAGSLECQDLLREKHEILFLLTFFYRFSSKKEDIVASIPESDVMYVEEDDLNLSPTSDEGFSWCYYRFVD